MLDNIFSRSNILLDNYADIFVISLIIRGLSLKNLSKITSYLFFNRYRNMIFIMFWAYTINSNFFVINKFVDLQLKCFFRIVITQ